MERTVSRRTGYRNACSREVPVGCVRGSQQDRFRVTSSANQRSARGRLFQFLYNRHYLSLFFCLSLVAGRSNCFLSRLHRVPTYSFYYVGCYYRVFGVFRSTTFSRVRRRLFRQGARARLTFSVPGFVRSVASLFVGSPRVLCANARHVLHKVTNLCHRVRNHRDVPRLMVRLPLLPYDTFFPLRFRGGR